MNGSSDARVALLRGLIDHAPLYPPALLEPPAALGEDQRALESGASFALGRLVWPASRLDELPANGRALSVVLDGELDGRDFEAVEAVFRKDLAGLAALASEVYVEVSIDGELESRLDVVASNGLRAKVRCGGARVPTATELARFLRACRERELPFKATAGLHHVRPTDGEHGLLNLLAAVVFGDEEAALEDDGVGAFVLDAEAFRWRDRVAHAAEIERGRSERLHSVGSCSFFEPIQELAGLGSMP